MRWRRLFGGIVAGAALLLLTSGCQNLNAPRAQTQRTEETPDTAGQEAHLEQLDDDILFGRVSPLDYDSTFGIYRAEASGNVKILGFANESGKPSPPFYYHQRRVYTLTRDGNVNIYDVDAEDVTGSRVRRHVLPPNAAIESILAMEGDTLYCYGELLNLETNSYDGEPAYYAVALDGSGYEQVEYGEIPQ